MISLRTAVIATSLLLAACASTPMLVTPTDEYYRGALVRLTDDERSVVTQGFSFRLDFSSARFLEPRAEGSTRTTADLYYIEHGEFVDFFNRELGKPARIAVAIEEVRVFTRAAADTGIETPVFALEWAVEVEGRRLNVRGRAGGEPYSIFRIWNATTNPISIRSSNIACFAAFLKAAIALEEEIASIPDRPNGTNAG